MAISSTSGDFDKTRTLTASEQEEEIKTTITPKSDDTDKSRTVTEPEQEIKTTQTPTRGVLLNTRIITESEQEDMTRMTITSTSGDIDKTRTITVSEQEEEAKMMIARTSGNIDNINTTIVPEYEDATSTFATTDDDIDRTKTIDSVKKEDTDYEFTSKLSKLKNEIRDELERINNALSKIKNGGSGTTTPSTSTTTRQNEENIADEIKKINELLGNFLQKDGAATSVPKVGTEDGAVSKGLKETREEISKEMEKINKLLVNLIRNNQDGEIATPLSETNKMVSKEMKKLNALLGQLMQKTQNGRINTVLPEDVTTDSELSMKLEKLREEFSGEIKKINTLLVSLMRKQQKDSKQSEDELLEKLSNKMIHKLKLGSGICDEEKVRNIYHEMMDTRMYDLRRLSLGRHGGEKGEQGSDGEKGSTGPKGIRGSPGEKGPKGELGFQGIDGPKGPIGPMGPPGKNGGNGKKGAKGDQGINGRDGLKGSNGAKGAKGEPGKPGPKGTNGIPGKSFNATGMAGPKGDRGEPGQRGKQGLPGVRGEQGIKGNDGKQGAPGNPGKPGLKGEKGDSGSGMTIATRANVILTPHDLNLMEDLFSVGAITFVTSTNSLYVKSVHGWLKVQTSSEAEDKESTKETPKSSPKEAVEISNEILSGPAIPDETPQTKTKVVKKIKKHTSSSKAKQHSIKDQLYIQPAGIMAKHPYLMMAALNNPQSGKMGGIPRLDTQCNEEAKAAGYKSRFQVFVSDDFNDIRTMIQKQYRGLPVANTRGEQLFPSIEHTYNPVNYTSFNPKIPIYSFNQRDVRTSTHWPIKMIWHGSHADGRKNMYDKHCKNWRVDSPAFRGTASSITSYLPALNEVGVRCDKKLIYLCIQIR